MRRGRSSDPAPAGPRSAVPGGSGTVGGFVEGVRNRLRRRSGAAAGLGVLGVAGAVLLTAWLLAGGQGWSPGTLLPLALVVSGIAGAVGLTAWMTRRFRRWSAEERVTAEMERSARLPPGSVRAQVELARRLPVGVSRSLSEAGEGAIAARLAAASGDLAGRAGAEANRHLGVAGAAALVVLVLVAVLGWGSPERSRAAWTGLLHAGALASPPPLPPLTLHPGDARLPRGTAAEVRIEAAGRDSVTVHWRAVGEVTRSRTEAVSQGTGLILLPPLTDAITYWATAPDGARTGDHELVPVEATFVTDLVVEVRFPVHTRLPPETHRGWAPPLIVPEGSELRIRGGVTGDGTAVVLRGADEGVGAPAGAGTPGGTGEPEAERPRGSGTPRDSAGSGPELARFPIEAGTFSGAWTPARSVTAQWGVEGHGEEEGDLPPPLEVELVPDAPPSVALPVPGEDTDLPLSLRMPLLLEAEDDHGVAWVEVEAYVLRGGNDGAEPRASGDGDEGDRDDGDAPVVDRIPTGERTRVLIRPMLDLTEWGLVPGDEVHLRARAADNAPRAQIAETAVYRLRMPDASRVREIARERIEEAVARTEELARSASRTARELGDLEARIRSREGDGDGRGFEAREELREILEARNEEARRLEELRAELEEARRALEEEDPAADLLRERLRELERLLDEALGSQERERIRELLERIQDGEPLPRSETLGEMAREQEWLRDRLEEVLERLRRSALEAAFEGLEEGTRNVTEAQEELAPRLEGTEEADEQDALADRTRELGARLESLLRELEGDGGEAVREALSAAAEELARAAESMARAGEAARDDDGERSREEGSQASQEARAALERMEEAREDWMDGAAEEVRDALRSTAHGALSLARRQDELRERMQRADPAARRALQGEMAALAQGLRNLGALASAATRHAPDLGRELSQAIGEAMAGVEEAQGGLGGGREPRPGAYPSAGRALEAMNRVALLALEGLDSLERGGEGSAMEQLLEELESLAGRQGDLNEEAASLSRQDGEPASGERLEELVAGQMGVGGAVEELARRPGAERSLGDLTDLAREAREIAEELEQGRLNPETLARQERVLERLLSAGRTLEREEETDEREGTPAGQVDRRVVAPLPPELLRELAVPLPSAAELEALTPGERRLVLEYFERMNRRRAGGGDR